MSEINNVRVYWLDESLVASGYPMLKWKPWDMSEAIADTLNMEKAKKRASILARDLRWAHEQFLTWIITQFDLTASQHFWNELKRYKFVNFVSSTSTMHRIMQMDLDKCVNKYVSQEEIDVLKRCVAEYKENPTEENFLKTIYNIPSGFELTARLSTNYRSLKNVYAQRLGHALSHDWKPVTDFIETLPMFDELIKPWKHYEKKNLDPNIKQNNANTWTDWTI